MASKSTTELILQLEKVMGNAPSKWGHVHWLEDAPLSGLEDENLCKPCADIALMEYVLRNNTDSEYASVRGSLGYESDSSCFCAHCKVPLQYEFTDRGCKQEIEHYTSSLLKGELAFEGPLTPEAAYGVEQVVRYIEHFPLYATPENLADATYEHSLFLQIVEHALDPSIPLPTFMNRTLKHKL